MDYLDYYIRTTPDKWAEVISFGVLLGVVTQDGSAVSVVEPGIWDYIGHIYVNEVPLKTLEGVELIHANLRTTTNLRQRALELAAEHPELTEAMGRLGDYFLLNEAGEARLPNSPYRVVF